MAKMIAENGTGGKKSKDNQSKSKTKRYTEKELSVIRSKLQPGETIRPDGILVWRPTKAQYNGPEKPKAVYANTLPELREKEEKALKELHSAISNRDSRITVNGMYNKWIKVKAGIRDNTKSNYSYMYEHFIEPSVLGRTVVANVGKSDILGFYNKLVDQGVMGVSTLANLQNLLTQIFGLAVDDRIIPSNPALGALKQFKRATNNGMRKGKTRKALTVAEQCVFLDYLDNVEANEAWRNLFTVLLGTGLRISELCGLTWNNIDFDGDMITIDHDLIYFDKRTETDRCSLSVNEPKTDAGNRMLPMLPFVKEALLREKERQTQLGLKCQTKVDGYENFVFVNRFQDVQRHSTCNRKLKRIIRDCNEKILLKAPENSNPILLPYFTCHSLRHTCVTRLIENGVNVVAVQHYVGHVDAATTLNIYTDCQKEFMKESFGLKVSKKYHDIFAENLHGKSEKQITNQPMNIVENYYFQESTTMIPAFERR